LTTLSAVQAHTLCALHAWFCGHDEHTGVHVPNWLHTVPTGHEVTPPSAPVHEHEPCALHNSPMGHWLELHAAHCPLTHD
jgi:hypothetical protein